jgi:protein-S-isoprenylcysteine O-methyltransferase Ste14
MSFLESRVPPPVVALVTALFMWLMSRIAPQLCFDIPAHDAFAIVVAAAGFVTSLLGVVTFRRAKTTVNPAKPHTASSLVTWGVYSLSRNPMYLGLLIMLLGWAIFLSNALTFFLLPVNVLYINRFQIKPEERALTSLFGDAYISYQSRVRRWL